MSIRYIGSGNPDGTVLCRSDDKIGFFGEDTPVVKQTITLSAGTTTTLLKSDIDAIVTALDAYGLVTKA